MISRHCGTPAIGGYCHLGFRICSRFSESLCLALVAPTGSVFQLASGSGGRCHGRLHSGVAGARCLCVSPFRYAPQGPVSNPFETDLPDPDSPSREGITLIPPLLLMSQVDPILLPWSPRLLGSATPWSLIAVYSWWLGHYRVVRVIVGLIGGSFHSTPGLRHSQRLSPSRTPLVSLVSVTTDDPSDTQL